MNLGKNSYAITGAGNIAVVPILKLPQQSENTLSFASSKAFVTDRQIGW